MKGALKKKRRRRVWILVKIVLGFNGMQANRQLVKEPETRSGCAKEGRTASKQELWAMDMPIHVQRDLITWGPPLQMLGLVGASAGSFLTASVLRGPLQSLAQMLVGWFRKDGPPRRSHRRPRRRS